MKQNRVPGGSLLLSAALFLGAVGLSAATVPPYTFPAPIFGIATAPDGSLLVADYTAGVVELRDGAWSLVAPLPTATDVAPIGRGDLFALTGKDPTGQAPTAQKLYRVSRGSVRPIADLYAFERDVNPDGGDVDSNPFDVLALNGGAALVADAGGNDLLIVNNRGVVDWVATFPEQLAPTSNLKTLAGCPDPPPELAWACGLPDVMPAQAVATSVAIGPDGAYYVGELTGIPAPTGMSRVWRVEPGARHEHCGASAACRVVADGFTSIVDLTFGPDGRLYVVELDEASWAAVEFQVGGAGGTVNACDFSTWTCSPLATGLPIPIATTVGKDGGLYAVIWALVPGFAQVVPMP